MHTVKGVRRRGACVWPCCAPVGVVHVSGYRLLDSCLDLLLALERRWAVRTGLDRSVELRVVGEQVLEEKAVSIHAVYHHATWRPAHVVTPQPVANLEQGVHLQVVVSWHLFVQPTPVLAAVEWALDLDHTLFADEAIGRPGQPRVVFVHVQPGSLDHVTREDLVVHDAIVLVVCPVLGRHIPFKLIST